MHGISSVASRNNPVKYVDPDGRNSGLVIDSEDTFLGKKANFVQEAGLFKAKYIENEVK